MSFKFARTESDPYMGTGQTQAISTQIHRVQPYPGRAWTNEIPVGTLVFTRPIMKRTVTDRGVTLGIGSMVHMLNLPQLNYVLQMEAMERFNRPGVNDPLNKSEALAAIVALQESAEKWVVAGFTMLPPVIITGTSPAITAPTNVTVQIEGPNIVPNMWPETMYGADYCSVQLQYKVQPANRGASFQLSARTMADVVPSDNRFAYVYPVFVAIAHKRPVPLMLERTGYLPRDLANLDTVDEDGDTITLRTTLVGSCTEHVGVKNSEASTKSNVDIMDIATYKLKLDVIVI